jgi:hypothetical protein
MSSPEIKMLAISNVFSRLMHFKKAGDVEMGHTHSYDHGTLLSSGSVQVDMLDDNNEIVSTKTFVAPTFIFINKNNYHRITALEDNTVCACIHAIKTIDDELVDPDFLVNELEGTGNGELRDAVIEKYNKEHKLFVQYR